MLVVEIIGNLGYDATVKNINGREYLSFDVAHEERNGNEKSTIWISILQSGNGGSLLNYLKKGTKVFARGTLTIRTYTSRDGQVKVSLSVIAREIQICQFSDRSSKDEQDRRMIRSAAELSQNVTPAQQSNGFIANDDDLPL